MNWNMPPAKGIVTGDHKAHKVSRVLITGAGVNAPGWTLYAEIHKGWPAGIGPAVTDWDPGRPISYMDAESGSHQLVEGRIWRGGAHAAVPDGAVVLVLPTGYVPSPEGPVLTVPRRSGWGGTDAERTALEAHPTPKSNRLQDVFPHLWTSPRSLSLVEETRALTMAAAVPARAIHCGIRALHGRWIYTTGKGRDVQNEGGCAQREDAEFMAAARMHAAWLEWHDAVLVAAGGRTDWLGGLRRPEPGVVFDVHEAPAQPEGERPTWYPWPLEEGVPGAQLKHILKERKLRRQDVAELLGVAKLTVDSWLRPPANSSFRVMPQQMLELLKRKLAESTENGGQADAQ